MESISAIVVYNDNYNKKYSGREETLSAVSEDNLFEQFYKKNNQLKYCNGCYYGNKTVVFLNLFQPVNLSSIKFFFLHLWLNLLICLIHSEKYLQ